ncbi:hypothetical protein ANCDUO_01474 [Ancylostoma duodenale]|uniref:Myosin motor domain-containing protein n=1 Tax=Ancylostoma duodenale TaxID=51022 RepID=A0A0C2DE27_9BILA|nr:hypothetical protein ANCDUO_01474 [Ancylostoma duodenale]
MKQSRTLPRCRPSEAPPPVPNRLATVNRLLDVHRLKDEIDKLSQQLLMVKAQLDSKLSDQSKGEENASSRFEENTLDSRLSTILCTPFENDRSPSPQPTRVPIQIVSAKNLIDVLMRIPDCPLSVAENPLSASSSKDFTEQMSQSKRASLCVNPGEILIPRLSRRKTFSHLDLSSRRAISYPEPSRNQQREAGSLGNVTAPPKPLRTFVDNAGNPPRPWYKTNEEGSTNIFDGTAGTVMYRCTDEKFLESIVQRFPQGSCWYMRDGNLFFVNPFSDISLSTRRPCPAISTISASLLKQKSASLIMRGVSGSGKSQIAELVCLDIVRRLCREGSSFSALHAAFVALHPFITTNDKHNNQSSRALAHVEFCVRNGRLLCVRLNHFMMDSPSRGCRANIFAMLANDLDEFDKEKYRISGFRLKEGHQGLGSVADLSSALGELGISASDVFKVISACILLNNLSFKEISGSVDIENLSDLEDASALLGVSALAMYRAVMRCTLTGNDSIRECQSSRDQLVSALYTRLVRRILMRANASLDNVQDLADISSSIGSGNLQVFPDGIMHLSSSLFLGTNA